MRRRQHRQNRRRWQGEQPAPGPSAPFGFVAPLCSPSGRGRSSAFRDPFTYAEGAFSWNSGAQVEERGEGMTDGFPCRKGPARRGSRPRLGPCPSRMGRHAPQSGVGGKPGSQDLVLKAFDERGRRLTRLNEQTAAVDEALARRAPPPTAPTKQDLNDLERFESAWTAWSRQHRPYGLVAEQAREAWAQMNREGELDEVVRRLDASTLPSPSMCIALRDCSEALRTTPTFIGLARRGSRPREAKVCHASDGGPLDR